MVERIPDSNYQQLQHFISESEWDAKAVMRDVARNTNQSLETLKGEKGLILNESGNEKAGTKSVGVARQYIGNVGKVCNSQVGVYAGLSRGDKISLVGAKLYLPKEWTTDKLDFVHFYQNQVAKQIVSVRVSTNKRGIFIISTSFSDV